MAIMALLASALLFAGLAFVLLASVHLCALVLVRLFHPRRRASATLEPEGEWPVVLVQLPLFNEGTLANSVLASVAALDWPRERLQVQVLDDSTDEGSWRLSEAAVAAWAERGLRVEFLHRSHRDGFKAGALAAGLARSDAPLAAIFDADFEIPADFLRRTAAVLQADDRLAYVQARWGFLNRNANLLTRAQARLLDGHFGVEQDARARLGLPVPFNGTCGLWRRAAIEDAGGWQGDTLTEDLDLSLRAHLRGWRSAYLGDLEVPGLLPESARAWRVQQFRWNKGFVQVLLKLGARIRRGDTAPALSAWWARAMMLMTLAQPLVFLAGLLCLLLGLPFIAGVLHAPGALAVLAITTTTVGLLGPISLLVVGALQRRQPKVAVDLVAALALTSGLLLSNARAASEALIGRPSAFVRTPKTATEVARGALSGGAELTVGLGLFIFALNQQPWALMPMMLLISGLFSFGWLQARESDWSARWVRLRERRANIPS